MLPVHVDELSRRCRPPCRRPARRRPAPIAEHVAEKRRHAAADVACRTSCTPALNVGWLTCRASASGVALRRRRGAGAGQPAREVRQAAPARPRRTCRARAAAPRAASAGGATVCDDRRARRARKSTCPSSSNTLNTSRPVAGARLSAGLDVGDARHAGQERRQLRMTGPPSIGMRYRLLMPSGSAMNVTVVPSAEICGLRCLPPRKPGISRTSWRREIEPREPQRARPRACRDSC